LLQALLDQYSDDHNLFGVCPLSLALSLPSVSLSLTVMDDILVSESRTCGYFDTAMDL
jgi:hypothetical protein